MHVFYNTELFLDKWIVDEIKKKHFTEHIVHDSIEIGHVLEKVEDKKNACFFTGMIYQYANIDLPKDIYKIGVCHGLRPIEKMYDSEQWRYLNNLHEWKEYIRCIVKKKKVFKAICNQFAGFLEAFDVIITVSNHSAYSIKTNLSSLIGEVDLRVFYTPLKRLENNKRYSVVKSPESDEKYIMMISANRWLKNSYRGLVALDQLYEQKMLNGVKTKIFGSLPERIKKQINSHESFEFIDYVSTEELEDAYQNCALFFYPTLNEGFGLPPMEAMKYGKTCAISSVCSLPEVYGDAVYYFNPYDIGEIKNRILMGIEKPIDIKTINERFQLITDCQEKDTNELCNLILRRSEMEKLCQEEKN